MLAWRTSLFVIACFQLTWSLEEATSCFENEHIDDSSARALLQVQKHQTRNEGTIAPGKELMKSEAAKVVDKAKVLVDLEPVANVEENEYVEEVSQKIAGESQTTYRESLRDAKKEAKKTVAKGEEKESLEKESQEKRESSQDVTPLEELLTKSPSAPSTNDTSNLAGTRLEMAKRALIIMHESEAPASESKESIMARATGNESSKTGPMYSGGTKVDEPEDVTHPNIVSGATAGLNEQGYGIVASFCCPLEMSMYAERVVTHFGFKVCNQGSLEGLVAWYYCANQSRTFQELADESMDAADGECAWVGTESSCPEMSENCPSFPDTSGHRRRVCGQRHEEPVDLTTQAPESTLYTVRTDTHCGFYQSCGGISNIVSNIDETDTTTPNADCVPLCDASAECVGFTYIHEHHKCQFRKNVTCGVFQSDGSDCWAKP